ncbi:hypothetical protein AJ80_04686 [Polytolypa hystricis UAMH7299]|uniref:Uncharacterized protein n=1 Tax=Polytolypa hystricis (strain UAMH7299) TaxID=1447883 RepID=A0A2B7YA00_POLH7|nr:hypothetical protein AJ80_04686 [Polytolypa hystricis UAMH7299]
MRFTIGNLLALGLGLMSCVAASPVPLEERDQKIIIGYRTVSAEQARRYNDAGTLTDDGNRVGTQIGLGVYTTPKRGQWPGPGDAWYCVILADAGAIKRVAKAWVPERSGGTQLWSNNDAIDKYIKDLESSWNPATTLRMSIISGLGWDDLQLVIPPKLLNSNGGAMGIDASCKQNVEDLPDYTVNYDDWHDNIKGNRT